MKFSSLILTLFLTGCAALVEPPDPGLLAEILGNQSDEATEKPVVVDVLAMSDELKAFVDARIDPKWRSKKRLEKLRSILFSPDLFAIEYQSGKTKTAIETYQSGSGNCLSMTNLFIAMARYSGLDAHYHLVTARPEWDRSGNTLIWTQHINSTGVLRNGDQYILDFLPQLRVIRGEMKTVSDQYAQAIYYSNLGAEAILNDRFEDALEYLRTALRIEPRMADVWNNMGATQNRLKRADLAKASFQQAIILDAFNNTAMSNLSRIYFAEGSVERGEFFADRVARYRNKNPYYRYANAKSALLVKDYTKAREELNAAIRLKKDEAAFFDALAEVYAGLGDEEKQLISLRVAKLIREESTTRRSSLEIYRSGNVVLR
ncbi:MAG: transglutaminase domain-containing protein [Gammaproteobacteria bacterium]